MEVQSVNKETMTVRCDGVDYPIMTATLSLEEMQQVVDYSEKVVNEIIKHYE